MAAFMLQRIGVKDFIIFDAGHLDHFIFIFFK